MSLGENLNNLGALIKKKKKKKGVTGLTGNEGLTTLANKILDIKCQSIIAYVTGDYISLGGNGTWLTSIGDVVIDWGDGTSDIVNNPKGKLSHTYTDGLNEHLIIFDGIITGLDGCFYECDSLTNVIIPNSVTSLEGGCFRKCSLISVIIPNSVTSLGNLCFSQCLSLTRVTIPNSVTSLGVFCFNGCNNLVNYELYWETQPVKYSSMIMPVNTDTVFTIPYGTTSIYVDAGYPSDRLVERNLVLSSTTPIIQKNDTAIVNAVLTRDDVAISGETLNYVIKHGNDVLDSGSVVTDSDGAASISYVGTGVGDVTFEVAYHTFLVETFVVEDCYLYDTTVHTRTTTSSSELITPIYNDYSFVSDNFCAEFVWQGNGEGVGVGIAPKGRTTPYHHLLNGCGTLKLSTYLGNESDDEIAGRWGSFQYNTDYRFKIEYMNGTVKYYINDELKIVYSDKIYLNGETRDLYFLEWNENVNIQVKDIKIKFLAEEETDNYNLVLSSDTPIIEKNNTAIVIASLTNNDVAVSGGLLSYNVKYGSIVLDSGTITTDNIGGAPITYTGTGVGDVTFEVRYRTILQETFVVQDCHFFNNGSTVTGLEIDSGVSCTSNNDYITITTSTNGEKYVTIPTAPTGDWEFETTLAEYGDTNYMTFVMLTPYIWCQVGYNAMMTVDIGNGEKSHGITLSKGAVLKVTYINGTMSVYYDNTLIESNQVSATGKIGYYTNKNRIQHIKNLKLKAL